MVRIADPDAYSEKESVYIQVRSAEGRIITDEILRQLPAVPPQHPQAAEWQIRQQGLSRLVKYLSTKGSPLRILDVGCGNGWMSHALYKAGHIVTGVDLNITELQQAEVVFGTSQRLQWVYADVLKDTVLQAPFDIILFAASCQYFPDIKALTTAISSMLKSGGEIHFIDSMFYRQSETAAAKSRTADYYRQLGFPAMSSFYFHHSKEELERAGYKKLYPGPFSFKRSLEWWMLRKN